MSAESNNDFLGVFYEEESQAIAESKQALAQAMSEGERDIKKLDNIVSPIMTALTADLADEDCLKTFETYISYLDTFNHAKARIRHLYYDHVLASKNHCAVAAAILLEELMDGRLGLDTIYVGSNSQYWIDKVAGMIAFAYPWNGTKLSDVLLKFEQKCHQVKDMVYREDSLVKYYDMLNSYPSTSPIDPSEDDLKEIRDAVEILLTVGQSDRAERVILLRRSPVATRARIAFLSMDLCGNDDLDDFETKTEYNELLKLL